MSVSPLAPAIAQVRRSPSTARQGRTSAEVPGSPVAGGASSSSHRVAGHHASSHTNPSAPVTTNAARHPNTTANGGISSGVRMAPMLGAELMSPSPMDRSVSGRCRAAAFTAAGVFTDSAAARATRAPTNWAMLAATAWAIPARLHAATATP